MDFQTLNNIVNSDAIFALLFVVGLYLIGKWFMNFIEEQKLENKQREEMLFNSYKEQLEKSNEREKRLIEHLDKNTEQLENIANTLTKIEQRLTSFEEKVSDDLDNVWKELDTKVDKSEFDIDYKI